MKKEEIFYQLAQLQDGVLIKHIGEKIVYARYILICDLLDWTHTVLSKSARDMSEEEQVLHNLFMDSFSSLTVSTRIALWGLPIDSLHILRPILESLASADYLIEQKKIQTYKSAKSFNRFNINWDTIKKQSVVNKDVVGAINKISDLASHFTIKRIRGNLYQMDGKILNRVGASYSPDEVSRVLGNVLSACLYMTRILVQFQIQEKLIKRQKNLEKKCQRFSKNK